MKPFKKSVSATRRPGSTSSTSKTKRDEVASSSGKVKIAREGAWKPAGQRRHLAALQRAIERSIQWAVFEINDEPVWAKVRSTVEDLLMKEWKNGSLRGATPEQAFFVRCDRTTMTQYDIDHGQIVLLAGVAPVKPAEFTTLRIAQSTAG